MPIAATFRRRRGSAVENGSRGRSSPSRSGKTWTLNGPACVLRRDTPRVNFTLLSRGARRPAVADAWGPPAEGRPQTVEHPHVWLLIVRLVAHADRLKKGIGDDVAASLRVLPHGVIRRNPRAEPPNLPSSRGRGEKLRPDFDDGVLAAHGRCARPHRETYPVTHRAYDMLTNLMRRS